VGGLVLDDDGPAGEPAAQHVPVRGTVHEGRRRQDPQGRARSGRHQLRGGAVHAEAGCDEVRLAPQDPLGQAGGASGVEDVAVVGGEALRLCGGCLDKRLLVPPGPRQERPVGVVGHLEEQAQVREVGPHLVQRHGHGAVEDDGSGPAVGQHVAELVGHVAVVDVHRGRPGLGRAEHALEVLVAVVQVEGDVVLGRLPRVLDRPRRATDAVGAEQRGEAAGPIGDLGPAHPAVPPHEALPVRHDRGDGLVRGGQVQLFGDLEDGHGGPDRRTCARLAACRTSSSTAPAPGWRSSR